MDLLSELYRLFSTDGVGYDDPAATCCNYFRGQRTQSPRSTDDECGAASELGRSNKLRYVAQRSLHDRGPAQEGLYRTAYAGAGNCHSNHSEPFVRPADGEPETVLVARSLDKINCKGGENRV